jgi:hypothetical protein
MDPQDTQDIQSEPQDVPPEPQVAPSGDMQAPEPGEKSGEEPGAEQPEPDTSQEDSPEERPSPARSSVRYWVGPGIAALTLTLLTGMTITTAVTGRPDGGAFAPGGIFDAQGTNRTNPTDGNGTGTRAGDTATDSANVVVDLNGDQVPDTRLDANNDGDTNDTQDPTIRDIVESRKVVTDTIAADPERTETSESLITPSGKDWWSFVISQAPELHFAATDAPQANWYAMTTHKATNAAAISAPGPQTYQAVHIGFPDAAAAAAYLEADTARTDAAWRFPLLRDTVLTYAPVWANPHDEPYPSKTTIPNTPTAASWSLNFGRQNAHNIAQAAPANQDALTTFYQGLGYTPTTTWEAVATNPEGPWTGKLTNYDTSALNTGAVAAALASTITRDCNADGSVCVDTSDGLLDLARVMAFIDKGGPGVGKNINLLPDNAPADAVLRFGYLPGRFAGVINDTKSAFHGPNEYLQGWITKDLTMVRYSVPGIAPDLPDQYPSTSN